MVVSYPGRGRHRRRTRLAPAMAALVLALGPVLALLPPPATAAAATLPSGFQETIIFRDLEFPTAVRFAPDGRVFVAEKGGIVKVFDNLDDPTPTIFADLRTKVHNISDRGLLGLAIPPNFATNPHIYVAYTHDAAIGGSAPRWGSPDSYWDDCPTPPGETIDGCVVSGRLSRLPASGNTAGPEQVLIEAWCQQYPAHSIGDLVFGADGALYMSAGEGASYTFADYGQEGIPLNPCGDPPAGVGGTQTPPTARGGALRAQSLRRPAGEPVVLSGAVIRIDPQTGAALPNNPLASHPDANARRIIAYGLRNPYRIALRPGTNEVWVADAGWASPEEINRIASATDNAVENFGWPCYEGNQHQSGYDGLNLEMCESLYSQPGAVMPPYFSYPRNAQIVPGEDCTPGSAVVSGITFYPPSGGTYPAHYRGALFFADYTRNCIWVMFPGAEGLPDPGNVQTFAEGAPTPVDLQIGPGGDLYYVDIGDFSGRKGTVRRISFASGGNQPPTAIASADRTFGRLPLTVQFDGTGSSDPDPGTTLRFAWDLDGDGAFDDSTSSRPQYTYTTARNYTVRLRVTDDEGASSLSAPVTISAGNTPPTASIQQPTPSTTWRVGDTIAFAGTATDAEDGPLPTTAFAWTITLQHCPGTCHAHPLHALNGVSSGTFVAQDHEYPSWVELTLTVTDARGLTDTQSVRLDPQTVMLNFETVPPGLQLAVYASSETAPFSRTVIAGGTTSLSAPSPQVLNGQTYIFNAWSDGGGASHNITATESRTYVATFTPVGGPGPDPDPGRVTGGHNVGGAAASSTIWYFAEGYTGIGFDQYFTILNPNGADAEVTITYFLASGGPVTKMLTARANARTTVSVHDSSQGVGRGHEVAARVESTNGVGIIVERPMYFRYGSSITDGHIVLGATAPQPAWYFAEGHTGAGFDQYLTILNPHPEAASVTLTYYLATGGPPVEKQLTVPATSRYTVAVHGSSEGVGRGQDVSTRVTTSHPGGIVVERPMYFTYGRGVDGGHNVLGATAPQPAWYFAEGHTGAGFDQYLTIQNPNSTPAQITLTYYLANGAGMSTRALSVPPTSRYTVAVHHAGEGIGRGHDVSVAVDSDQPIVVERPMYFTYGNGITGGHNVLGANAPRDIWLFAEGHTGAGFDQYLTIQNPNDSAAETTITYFLGHGGPPITKTLTVPANARYTVSVHDAREGVGRSQDVSARVTTSHPGGIVVERPMYFTYGAAP